MSEGNADRRFTGAAQASFQALPSTFLVVGTEVSYTRVTQPTFELDPATGQPDPRTISGGLRGENGDLRAAPPGGRRALRPGGVAAGGVLRRGGRRALRLQLQLLQPQPSSPSWRRGGPGVAPAGS